MSKPAIRLTRPELSASEDFIQLMRHAQSWNFYSLLRFKDFRDIESQQVAFWQETRGQKGPSVTNITQPGTIPEAFLCSGIGVRIAVSPYDDPRIFHLLCNHTAIDLKVGSDEMMVGPTTMFPSGGGMTGMVEGLAASAYQPGGGGSGDQSQADIKQQRGKGAPTSQITAPSLCGNVLSNGVTHRNNLFTLSRGDEIKIKKGANISSDLHISQDALTQLRELSPQAPGATVMLILQGRRARAAGYGTGG